MARRLVVSIGVVVCALCDPLPVPAQTPPPGDGWVVLPVDEYRALRERANPQPRAVTPPVDATLTRVDYDLHLDTESAAGTALLTIDVLRDGWTRVQIPAGLMVRAARLAGQPVSLVEGPPPYVLLSRAGRLVLTLDVAMPLTSSAGTESISVPPSAAPITRATLTLPRSGIDLSVAGGFVADRVETSDESRWTTYGRPNQALTLSWKRKVDDRRAAQPLRTRARVTALVGLGEEISQVTAAVRIDVQQGLAREIALLLPPGLAVSQVNGATVADWDVSGSTLRVRFLEPIASEADVVVQGDVRTPREGAVEVPLIRMPSAERESGGVAVDVAGAGEITGRQAIGLEPTDPMDLGDVVAGHESPSLIGFRLKPLSGTDTRSLTVNVIRYTPQAVLVANIEEARYRVLAAEDGRLLVEARYAVRNNQRSFVKVSLPPGSDVWTASLAGRPIRPGVADHDAVLLPLEKGRAGEQAPTFLLQLIYLQRTDSWPANGTTTIDLPALDLPISRTGLELYYPPRFRVNAQPGAFHVEDDPGPFAEALRHPASLAPPRANELNQRGSSGLQALVDRFNAESGGRTVTGALPVHVEFPPFGPSMFLASELTAEMQAQSVDLTFKRNK